MNTRRTSTPGVTAYRSFVKWLGPVSFHQRHSLVFIYMLLLPERQTGAMWKSNFRSYLRGHRIVQHWHSHAVWSDNTHCDRHTPRHGLPKAFSLGVKHPEPQYERFFQSHSGVIHDWTSIILHHTCSSPGA